MFLLHNITKFSQTKEHSSTQLLSCMFIILHLSLHKVNKVIIKSKKIHNNGIFI
jgi:hypothetical protein